MRKIARIALVLVAAYILLSAAFFSIAHLPPPRFAAVMARAPRLFMFILPFSPLWTMARAGSLNVGDRAPDFRLPTVDKQHHVQLASFRGDRPVVLVFGSYT
jgi:hypothetical protein